ncbi:MAG: hypothetical protein LC117_10720 [Bacteroidia bacterium]|nr:hypothetical protein [Bacteroidia bacterium]MCZ2278388.1 hypothetical protein [Bacteroidia bacterium]
MIQHLHQDFQVTTIGVFASSPVCLARVQSRDQQAHINFSADQVLIINEKVRARNYKTNFNINNENKSEIEILNEIRAMVG